MHRTLRSLILCSLIPAVALLAACGGGSVDGDDNESSATMSPSTEAATSTEDPAAEARKQFQAAQRRVEEERQRLQALQERRRGFIAVAFQEIDAEGRVIVTLTNQTDRDIDDVRGGIQAADTDGNYLAATGLTEAVPGDIFLAAGAEMAYTPYGFSTKQQLIEHLRSDPSSVRFTFEALGLTYADGVEEPDLDS